MFFRRRQPRPQISSQLQVAGLNIAVTRKNMKYLRLKVSPPDGAVSLSAPHTASKRELEALVLDRLAWIKQQQSEIRARPAPPICHYNEGDSIQLWGEKLQLVRQHRANSVVRIVEQQLSLPENLDQTALSAAIDNFYRTQLRAQIAPLAAKWQPQVGREAAFWGIKKMKTRWGSCNTQRRRIWLNLELAKQPLRCTEYVIVHELVHLHEASHNRRFYDLLSQAMPDWKTWDNYLNRG